MSYVPDKRPTVAISGWSNQNYGGGQPPFGMHPSWNGTDAAAIAAALLKSLPADHDRVLLWQIAGNNHKSGFLTFSAWHVLSEPQRLGLAMALRAWKATKPGRVVNLYGGWASDPFARDIFTVTAGERRWWEQQLGPMVAIGIDEVGLDSGSNPAFWPEVELVDAWIQHGWGLRRATVEAIPMKRTGSGAWVFDLARMARNPSCAWWSNFGSNPVYASWRTMPPLPPEIEAHVFLGGSSVPPTQADADLLAEKGFVPGWVDAPFKLG